ncbi:MAG: hypothetical protein LAQ30_31055 [Acidobacteriia bacterium]|nr:hypothetical protein [Terriglobia bacterium]
MPNRTRLHQLLDTLPEPALNMMQGALENFQSWPPVDWGKEPERFRELRESNRDRVRQSSPGIGGGSGGFMDGYVPGPGGRVEYGSFRHSFWDGDSVVVETHRFHAGHELVIEERMRLTDGGTKLQYLHTVTGPDLTADRREMVFTVAE